MKKENSNTKRIVLTGVFAALVFVSNYLSIPIPVTIGSISRIHLGNGLCILSGLFLGPVAGGLAAGIGSGLYDLLSPIYITSAPFTFVFKFLLAAIPGLILHKLKKPESVNVKIIIGGILGQIVYIVLYLSKSFIEGLLQGSAAGALVPTIITKLITSSTNAVIAIIISVTLYKVIKKVLDKNNINT
ncbi:MAG: ECF transporter S component [Clostridia bacterium]